MSGMSEKEILRKLKEGKEQKEKAYIKFQGMLKGIRLGKLSPSDKRFLNIVELMFKGFKNLWDDIISSFEAQMHTNQRVSNLEKKIQELENNILQLRLTLDRMAQDR